MKNFSSLQIATVTLYTYEESGIYTPEGVKNLPPRPPRTPEEVSQYEKNFFSWVTTGYIDQELVEDVKKNLEDYLSQVKIFEKILQAGKSLELFYKETSTPLTFGLPADDIDLACRYIKDCRTWAMKARIYREESVPLDSLFNLVETYLNMDMLIE